MAEIRALGSLRGHFGAPHVTRTSRADTIVAIATPIGESAIGIVRVSGLSAVATVAPLLRSTAPLSSVPSHTARLVTVVNPRTGQPLDEALCTVMRGPRSYTGEDVVELACHGSPALLRLVVDLLIASGARLAEPGEFTRRAFLNGRLDLARAEAVALLIAARTGRAVALAARALAGGLAAQLSPIRERLVDLIAGLEVALDFPDEQIGADVNEAAKIVGGLRATVAAVVIGVRRGQVVQHGLTVAIVGPPNAGKSSLLNALVGRERAIVSPEAGTTRDVLEAGMTVAGIPVRLLDTAGLGIPRDTIDAEGMRRSRRAIAESDLLVVVLDGTQPPVSAVLVETETRPRILVRAKSDLPTDPEALALEESVATSTKTPHGLDALVARLTSGVERLAGSETEEGEMAASLRQVELLQALATALHSAEEALAERPIEVALIDLKDALRRASLLLGVEVGDVILDTIFSRFCVGK